ncbi:unnamed protein product [Caenorhabditis auriculariae]|uniref:EF-hand domain-containing protein n=1 Tax=Caenorhabditis auriculariae TaxID=2777116 RepID=A0A8S1HTC4_9PELO|nr:unnamed protein product [Caenorhabditis auriculariae]
MSLTINEFRRIAQSVCDIDVGLDRPLAYQPEEGVINAERLADILRQYEVDGFIDLENFVRDTRVIRDETINRLLGFEDEPDDLEENDSELATEGENSTDLISNFQVPVTSVRGFLAISPSLFAIRFNAEVETPSECEIVLSMTNNSDVPAGQFDNDLFVVIYRQQSVVGITQFVLKNKRYSTGVIKLEKDDELMTIGMGTSYSRRKATGEREVLLTPDGRLSKRFRVTLMNIFEDFDIDMDGLLNRKEHDFYTIATGDVALNDEEWSLVTSQFNSRDGCLTLDGFLKMHQLEATSGDEHVIEDMWTSLHRLGYDSGLQSIYGCSFNIEVFSQAQNVSLIPELHFVTREDRTFILQKLYDLGVEEQTCDLRPRIFRTEYFGLLIAHKNPDLLGRRYRLSIEEDRNVRWNFVSGRDVIHMEDSDSEWVLIVSYTVMDEDYAATFSLIEN